MLQKLAEKDLDYATAHFQLGEALRKQQDVPKALRHYQWTLNLNPNHVPALQNLAWLLAIHPKTEIRDAARAIELAEKSCKLSDYKSPAPLAILAAVCAEADQFDDAVRWQTKAIEVSPSSGHAQLKKFRELYKAGKSSQEITPGILELRKKPPE